MTPPENELETLRSRLAVLEAAAKPAVPLSEAEIHHQRVVALQAVHAQYWPTPPKIYDPFAGVPAHLLAPRVIRPWPTPSVERRGDALIYCGSMQAFAYEHGTRAKDTNP